MTDNHRSVTHNHRKVSTSSGMSQYLQVAGFIRDDIDNGRYLPEEQLPTQKGLADEFGTSVKVVQRAIGVLESEWRVVRAQGQPTRMRKVPPKEAVRAGRGDRVDCRMPTPEEKTELGLDIQVALLIVTRADGAEEMYPADRYFIKWPK